MFPNRGCYTIIDLEGDKRFQNHRQAVHQDDDENTVPKEAATRHRVERPPDAASMYLCQDVLEASGKGDARGL